ncbi:MAG: hypothetical protein AAF708_16600 [Deinococcota bacterium]
MTSHVTREFRKSFADLPTQVQRQARKNYKLWRQNPHHESLQSKRVSQRQSIYSVRVSEKYRALGLVERDAIYWFWIGKHDEYDKLLKRLN